MPALNPLTHWRRSRGDGRSPRWAFGAMAQSAAADLAAIGAQEACWLQRVLLSCFGLTVCARERLPAVCGLADLAAELASRDLTLHACRLRDVRELRRGDVIRLDAVRAARLCAALEGEGLAVVVDDGAQWLRLRAASSDQLLTCARSTLRGLRDSPMLRVVPVACRGDEDSSWDAAWSDLR